MNKLKGVETNDAFLINCDCGDGVAILLKKDFEHKVARCEMCGNVYTHENYTGSLEPTKMQISGLFYNKIGKRK